MWVQTPDARTWGPVTRSVSTGGFTVTATARVDRVVWSMGDGEQVVCRTPGTAYADRFADRSRPDCGYRYVEQGERQVEATSYWQVEWSGIGQSGVIGLELTAQTQIVVGELQVLVTSGGSA
jgi:hypothetical protein